MKVIINGSLNVNNSGGTIVGNSSSSITANTYSRVNKNGSINISTDPAFGLISTFNFTLSYFPQSQGFPSANDGDVNSISGTTFTPPFTPKLVDVDGYNNFTYNAIGIGSPLGIVFSIQTGQAPYYDSTVIYQADLYARLFINSTLYQTIPWISNANLIFNSVIVPTNSNVLIDYYPVLYYTQGD